MKCQRMRKDVALPLPETLFYFAGPLSDLLAFAVSVGNLFLSQSRPFQNSEREPDSDISTFVSKMAWPWLGKSFDKSCYWAVVKESSLECVVSVYILNFPAQVIS